MTKMKVFVRNLASVRGCYRLCLTVWLGCAFPFKTNLWGQTCHILSTNTVGVIQVCFITCRCHILAVFLVTDLGVVVANVAIAKASISSKVGGFRTGVYTGLVETSLVWLTCYIFITGTPSF